MYVGNVFPTEDNIGFKDARLGWDSLINDSSRNVTLTSEGIQNLIDMVFLQSKTKKGKVYYNKLEYKHIAVSFPLGQCLRYHLIKRNPEKYAVNITKTERYRMSAVPFLQRLLNDDYAMQKKNLKSLLQVNNDVIYNVPIT